MNTQNLIVNKFLTNFFEIITGIALTSNNDIEWRKKIQSEKLFLLQIDKIKTAAK